VGRLSRWPCWLVPNRFCQFNQKLWWPTKRQKIC